MSNEPPKVPFNAPGPSKPFGPLKLVEAPPVEAPIAHATEKTVANAWKNFKNDVQMRFDKGINPHAKEVIHEGHSHAPNFKVTTLDKVGFAAGSAVSLGVALHGLRNIKRGLMGWEDKELGEKHDPSVQYTVVGAAETVGGLALAKKLLTGTMKIF